MPRRFKMAHPELPGKVWSQGVTCDETGVAGPGHGGMVRAHRGPCPFC